MKLHRLLTPARVLISPPVRTREELFHQFAKALAGEGDKLEGVDIVKRLMEREKLVTTGIGGGVAVPHAQLESGLGLVLLASTHPAGIAYPSLDGQPVRLVFCILGDRTTASDHLACLARVARLARRRERLTRLVDCEDPKSFLEALEEIEREV